MQEFSKLLSIITCEAEVWEAVKKLDKSDVYGILKTLQNHSMCLKN